MKIPIFNLRRREFLSSSVACLTLGAVGINLAKPSSAQAKVREHSLTIAKENVRIIGGEAPKITINGTIPGPVLRFAEGEDAVVHVTNNMNEDTSVHWHGLVVPGPMDGAPGFNGAVPIKPGETFTYRFPIVQSGTYWYHSHSGGQEQDGHYGAIIISPKSPEPQPADRDYVVMLSDYSRETWAQILGHLKMDSDYYQYRRRTLGDLADDINEQGLTPALRNARQWGQMRMLETDLSDVSGYTFLTNGKSPAQNWTGLFNLGERVKLRIINAGTMTMFDVRIPGLKMLVVAADGQDIVPIEVDEFRMGTAETYDVIVTPTENKAYTFVAESLDREGFALGTLAPREGMKGEIPSHRPRARLTMADMNMEQMMKDDPNMDMSNMDMNSGWSVMNAPEGTKVLNYDELVSLRPHTDLREPSREITVRLGGNMQRYIWTMNGRTFNPMHGIDVGFNERVRIIYINETMMAHPIHLHGMFVQLDNGQDIARMPNKHTVIVPPGQTASVILTADNTGAWPFHCHLLYHMAVGMMTTLNVSEPQAMPVSQPNTPPEAPNSKGHNHVH
ncbi:MAG: multicopper oxidase domain-containing protein [Proteobacteria bacterium]|nr:multicopper oxidase domain-containing protein [Pseudomonadota bacterium]